GRDQQFGIDRRRAGAGVLGLRITEIAGREQAGDARLVGAMIGALELENLWLAGERAGKTLTVHGRFGARRAEAQALGGRAQARDLLGKRERLLVEIGEVRS